jgi:non-ribosomal peptide synthetase component F
MRRHGSAASLPRVTPYRDYLGFIARQDRAAGLAAWREALAGLEEGTRLAPRQAGREPLEPEHIVLSVDPALSASLNRTAREQALTLNTVMQAAWGILLGRLSGRDDVVFGVTVAGRPAELAGVEHMVGLFINTLPLRLQLRPELPLSALLRQTQDSQSRLMAHQHLGLAEIQQAAGVGDLFDTLLVFENYPVDRAGLAAAGLGTTGNGSEARPGPWPRRDALSARADRAAGRDAAVAARLPARPVRRGDVEAIGRRLIRLLEAAVADAGQPLGHLPILERPSATPSCAPGTTRRSRFAPATLPALFAAQAMRHAGRGCGGVRGPHAHIRGARRSRQPAGASAARLGRRPGCSGRSLCRALARTGGGIAGGAQGRRRLCAARSGVSGRAAERHGVGCGLRVVLLQGAAVEALPLQEGVTRILLELDTSPSLLTSVSAPSLDDLHADHLAYMIYTSGSTGKPKGAANTHAGTAQSSGLDAGRLSADRRRRGAAEDAVQLRRLGVGVLLAADRRRQAGDGCARCAPRPGAAR